jgi:prepilin-type N-terminal cleavage/methylation domain-containing protein
MIRPSRRAFTLVELLVVIAIIGVLMGLLLPAINAARERARQATCTNNLSQMGKAIAGITSDKGDYPGWVQLTKLPPSLPLSEDRYAGTPNVVDLEVSWAARLLPNMDAAALWQGLRDGSLLPNLAGPQVPNIDDIPRQEFYVCPSAAGTNADAPMLSYVANTGGPDVDPANTPGSRPAMPGSDHKANGVFHNKLPGFGGPTVRAGADIKDGSNRTLLFSENIHIDEGAGPGSQFTTSWLRSSALFSGSPDVGEQPYGMVWVFDQGSPASPTTQMPLNREFLPGTQGQSPDSYTAQGFTYARPASEHPDLVIVVFCGGNTRSINQDIEYRVYQQLMTPKGADCVWTEDPTAPLQTAAPPFRNLGTQLSDSEY